MRHFPFTETKMHTDRNEHDNFASAPVLVSLVLGGILLMLLLFCRLYLTFRKKKNNAINRPINNVSYINYLIFIRVANFFKI